MAERSDLGRQELPAFAKALAAIHRPASPADVEPVGLGATRLAYDECSRASSRLLMRARMRRLSGRANLGDGAWRPK